MSVKERDKCCVYGFIRDQSLKMDIPKDIIEVILLFYHLVFIYQYKENHVEINENRIMNKNDSWNNTTTINHMIDPEENKIHKLTIKIMKQTGCIGVGVVAAKHLKTSVPFVHLPGSYSYFNTGMCYNAGRIVHLHETRWEFGKDDIITLTFDTSTMSLMYQKIGNDGQKRHGNMAKEGSIPKLKYYWAVGIYKKEDSCAIIGNDIH